MEKETLLVTPNPDGNPIGAVALYGRNKMPYPHSSQAVSISVSGGTKITEEVNGQDVDFLVSKPGESVTLTGTITPFALNWWQNYPGFNSAEEELHIKWSFAADTIKVYGNSITIIPGGTIAAGIAAVEKGRLVQITVGESDGGYLTEAQAFGWPGAFMRKALVRDDVFISYDAIPSPGYEFAGWSGPLAHVENAHLNNLDPKVYPSMHATFKEKDEATLDIEIEGCGYVTANPTGKYYPKDNTVTITAHPAGNCCWDFEEWGGDAVTLNGNPIAGETSIWIPILMKGDASVTANFVRGDSAFGQTPYYVQPVRWDFEGYSRDFFHHKLTEDLFPGLEGCSEDIVVRESFCYLDSTITLSQTDIHNFTNFNENFTAYRGSINFPASSPHAPSQTGLWLVGPGPIACPDPDGNRVAITEEKFPYVFKYLKDSVPGTEVRVRLVQKFTVVAAPGYPDLLGKRIAASIYTHRSIRAGGDCYQEETVIIHEIVDKDGEHHPCAWDSGIDAGYVSGTNRLECDSNSCP